MPSDRRPFRPAWRCALAAVAALAVVLAAPLQAQRGRAAAGASPAVTRAAIDSFVVTVRDMAAWALVTPAAHIPVGALQDSTGYVQAIVDGTSGTAAPTDSVLAQIRRALGTAARRTRATAIALSYFAKRTPPAGGAEVDAVVVEFEHRGGQHGNVFFPYTRDEEGRPVFAEPFTLPGTLRGFGATRR